MPGCIVSATTASFKSVEKRRGRVTPVITSTFENVSDIGVCLGLFLGPPASDGVRSKRGALHGTTRGKLTSILKAVAFDLVYDNRQTIHEFASVPSHLNGTHAGEWTEKVVAT